MAIYTSRIKPKRVPHRTITRNPFLNPQQNCGSFEAEYQKFIDELKEKKETENAKVEETPVEDVGETLVSETALEIVESKPKKTRKKKEVVVEETDISEEPINEVPEQTETTEA